MTPDQGRINELTPEIDPYGYLYTLIAGKRGLLLEGEEFSIGLSSSNRKRRPPYIAVHLFTEPDEFYVITPDSGIMTARFLPPTITGIGEDLLGIENSAIGTGENAWEKAHEIVRSAANTVDDAISAESKERDSAKERKICIKIARLVERNVANS